MVIYCFSIEKINEQAGAELCQAQLKQGLALPYNWLYYLAKVTAYLYYYKLDLKLILSWG